MTGSFEKAAAEAMILKQTPNNEEMSALYGFYKQATFGDINTVRPGIFDLKGRGKWDAWNAKKGLPREEAKASYIDMVEKLKEKYGI